MSNEYENTPNYDLVYPTDDAPIDTAADFEDLALDVDQALLGINVDTAGKTDFSSASGPLRFYGTGRPDAEGLNLTAPTGSQFVCTDPGGVGNMGAQQWK